MINCKGCGGDLSNTRLDKRACTWVLEKGVCQKEDWHLSCLMGSPKVSRLAGMANSFACNVLDLLNQVGKGDDEVDDLIDEGQELINETVKWLEPEDDEDG